MELTRFMQRVGASDQEVAAAIDRDRSTISRIRRKVFDPDARTLLRLNCWADEVARRKRLRRSEWLSWDYLTA